ncbi:MAG: UDP-N-acetylmuramoyl-L-alanyl-D-glutamate--2,6-diaminopimelate ligase [Elusimicrobiota bacterium]
MRLADLFEYYKPDFFDGDFNIEINDIYTSSKKVKKDGLFFAFPGSKTHGKEYIKEAASNGALAVVSDENTGNSYIPDIVVDEPRRVLSKWSAAINGFPAKKISFTGVTGTNGKTTVTNLIYRILKKQECTALIGTSGYFYKNETGNFDMTTPLPNELHRLFKKLLDQGVKNIVMEVSSHALSLKRVEDIKFDTAVFTNLTRDHLEFHGGFEGYFKSKKHLFDLLSPEGVAIVNNDDKYGTRLVKEHCSASNYKTVTYGIKEKADYRAELKKLDMVKSEFILKNRNLEKKIKTKLIGEFNIYNSLAAIAAGIEGGKDMQQVCKVISEVSPVKGRLEIVRSEGEDNKSVVIDYAHTPDALDNVLRTLRELNTGRLICLFGCGGDRDREKRPLMGQIAGNYADVVYVTSDNPRWENPVDILLDIELGLRKTSTPYYVIKDREKAIKEAVSRAGTDDCILIAGKGDEEYQIFKDKKFPFSDRKVVRKYL